MLVGSDGSQASYYPQGSGLWSNLPALADDSPKLLDTFMWGDQHTAVYRSDSDDWTAASFNPVNANWVVRKPIYRYGMSSTNVGGSPVIFGGFHENWVTSDSSDGTELVMIGDGALIFSEERERRALVIPPTEWLGARVKSLMTYVQPGKLFVWGGCTQFVNEQCVNYSGTGAVLNAALGR